MSGESLHLARLERLLEVSRELVSTVSLELLLHKIVEAAAELTETESAGILLFDKASGRLRFVAATNFADQLFDIPVPVDSSIAGAAFSSGQPVIVPDVSLDPRYYHAVEAATGFVARALLAFPLQFQERRIGVLEVENKRDDSAFGQADVDTLAALAAQAAVAIENTRLHDRAQAEIAERTRAEAELRWHRDQLEELVQARVVEIQHINAELEQRAAELAAANERLHLEIEQRQQAQAQMVTQQRELATLEERERLGRDLHDGLGQVMGFINVQAQAVRALVASGQAQAALSNLDGLARAAQDAHADIRSHIVGLSAAGGDSRGLFEVVRESLQQLSQGCGIETKLSLPSDLPQPAFAPTVEEQILRIVQEALANVRKHAQASRVELTFSFTPDHAHIIIADDGVGFAPDLSSHGGHFGLSIMRERAAQIGGQLDIRSAPGKGTQVLLGIPRFLQCTPTEDELLALQGVRVLLADDHPLFLDGLRSLLAARGLTVVGVAHDGLQAQDLARSLQPDVIVMDVSMPHCDGLEATRCIHAELPAIKIVMLSVSSEDESLFEALKSGASGYLLKSLDANELCAFLAGLLRGEAPLAPGLAARVLSEFARPVDSSSSLPATPQALTPRQSEILTMVAQGLTYKEIGAALHLAENTVKYHMGQIIDRLHLANRAQAIAYARQASGVSNDPA
jgi:DNA-binding NarL/FixJ family response regulator/signal transduction histidine kinase